MTTVITSQAATVLDFWFAELSTDQHFSKDDALDAEIARRFTKLRDHVLAIEAEGWRDTADTALAAVILLDQFSRNIYRDTAAAFAADPMALDIALSAIAAGHHQLLPPARRAFLYMPLMHAEDRGVALFSQRCFAEPGLEKNRDFAHDHAAVIARFGRYPTRNAALGRSSTPAEQTYLAQPDVGW